MSDEELTAQVADPETIAENQVEEVTEAETEEETPPETDEAKEERKRESAKERRERDKASRQKLRDDLAAAQAKIAEMEAANTRIATETQGIKKPVEAEFSDYAEYMAALVDWKSDLKSSEQAQKTVTATADAAKQEAMRLQMAEADLLEKNWQSQAEEAATRYADFEKVVGQQGLFPKGSALVAMVQASDVAADLAYRLASDKALHDKLLRLHPVDAAREIGRLEATISTPKPRTSTKAPEPITPVRGTGGATRDPSKMSVAEFAAYRAAGGKV